MKYFKYIIYSLSIIIGLHACTEGIDPISPEESGTDELAPTVTISSPQNGDQLIVANGVGVPILLEAIDDIELESVAFLIDGQEVGEVVDFKDYRRYAPLEGHVIDLEDGAYTMQVSATDKTTKNTISELINFSVIKMSEFEPVYGETFYMSFQNHFLDHATVNSASIEGEPTFESNGKIGAAYQGNEASNLSYSVSDVLPSTEMSATFWYNIASQGRSGILSASPTGSANNRIAGFRLFREGGDDAQTIKLNIGNGSYDQWFDGGAAATINPQTTEWVHIAITISSAEAVVYIDGEVVSSGALDTPMSLDNCEDLYIASSGPYFSEWGHGNDMSQFDELRLYQTAISQDQIKVIIAAEH